jgi:hypothetical protein
MPLKHLLYLSVGESTSGAQFPIHRRKLFREAPAYVIPYYGLLAVEDLCVSAYDVGIFEVVVEGKRTFVVTLCYFYDLTSIRRGRCFSKGSGYL